MLPDLAVSQKPTAGGTSAVSAQARQALPGRSADRAAISPSGNADLTSQAVKPNPARDRLAELAQEHFKEREIDVRSFRDEASDRVVVRVTDRATNQLLVQSPADELLRFFAGGREVGQGILLDTSA
ncbi:MAG: flagellar protein FlaG [Geminicoccaceae bacterium]|nr:flagellar protein FlaG [Geminicoccaceae bacterium]